MANSQAVDAIRRARVRLLSSHPFYGHLACRLKLREFPGEMNGVPMTMATDGIHLYYNPEFVLGQTKTQLVASMAHEITHVYLEHPLRMQDVMLNPETDWQFAAVAADMAINPRLKDAGFDLFPEAVYPEKQYWDVSFEEHYKRLKKQAKQQGGGKNKHKCTGGCSGVQPLTGKDGKKLSAAERTQLETQIRENVMSAANFARAAGKLPADIERLINDLRAPKISWKDVLRRFMTATTKNDYRMMPPNRRYIHQNLYLPSLRSDAVEDVLLIIDGSGSTYQVFPQFISEFASVLLDVRPERLHVMVWDTRCTWKKEFDGYSDESQKSIAALQPEMGAGGGTVFTECFDWFARETGITPQVGIVLTDMELFGEWPADPGYPVLWIASTDIIGPYGETVRIEE